MAALRLGGMRGKKSTPSVWLGGTGELVKVGKQEQEQLGAGAAGAQEFLSASLRQRYGFSFSIIECRTIMPWIDRLS